MTASDVGESSLLKEERGDRLPFRDPNTVDSPSVTTGVALPELGALLGFDFEEYSVLIVERISLNMRSEGYKRNQENPTSICRAQSRACS